MENCFPLFLLFAQPNSFQTLRKQSWEWYLTIAKSRHRDIDYFGSFLALKRKWECVIIPGIFDKFSRKLIFNASSDNINWFCKNEVEKILGRYWTGFPCTVSRPVVLVRHGILLINKSKKKPVSPIFSLHYSYPSRKNKWADPKILQRL